MRQLNTRADLELLRGTDEFEGALRDIHGSITMWVLVDGEWQASEDLSVLARMDFTKSAFLAEAAEYDFPEPSPPPVPPAAVEPNPLEQSLTKRQIVAAMILGGGILDPDAAITAAIEQISDPVAQALALNDWRNAPYYARTHDLFNNADLLAAMSMTSQDVDGLWVLGWGQPR